MNVQPDIEGHLKRLMLFRVVMGTTLLFIATYIEAVSETLFVVNPLYFVIAVTYALTVAHALALRLFTRRVVQAYVQVAGDLLIITALVWLSGGVRTGFLLLYPLSILSATFLVPRRGAVLLAGLGAGLYAALLVAVRLGLPAWQGLADVPTLPLYALVYAVFVLGVACVTVALLGAYLVESLQHAGRQLREATVQMADLRELNQVIVGSMQSGLMTSDPGGRILYVNDFGGRILGRAPVSMVGTSISDTLGPALAGACDPRASLADRTLARLEIRYHRSDGQRLELGVSVTPLTTDGASGLLIVFQDLTEVRALEEAVRTKEKLAAVGEMAAQLAHEIRNPLGSIRGSAQVLMAEPALGEEQSRLLQIIFRESKRLSDTLNRFLYQTRAPARPYETVDLGPVLEAAVTLLRNGSDLGPAHAVVFDAGAGPYPCLADPDQITQVFWNLVRNALEAMPHGGHLGVALRNEQKDIVLTVRDQGRGMGRDEQRRLFEPVQDGGRLSAGLGLAIVFRIVREHGGDIMVRSDAAHGTEVEVRLPRASAARSGPGGVARDRSMETA